MLKIRERHIVDETDRKMKSEIKEGSQKNDTGELAHLDLGPSMWAWEEDHFSAF